LNERLAGKEDKENSLPAAEGKKDALELIDKN